MIAPDYDAALEDLFDQWRTYLRRRRAIHATDISELEDHLREQVDVLIEAGLMPDEAFLVAVKRMGSLDALSREFALEHSHRLWKQLVVTPSESDDSLATSRKDAAVAFGLAIAAAVLIKIPALLNLNLDENAGFYLRNLSLFVLPLLTGYFVWKRGLDRSAICWWLVTAFIAAAVFANAYPFTSGGATEVLTTLHLPIALWLVVGTAYAGGRWGVGSARMDFIRFSGELFIYYVLIALGGGLLTGFMALTFQSIGIDIGPYFESWILPCGVVGTVIVAAWLVEAKQSVVENMAPVLTRLFTPLLATMLLTFLGIMAWTGRGIDIDRDVLIAFDLLLVLVLALVLYSLSAREPRSPPDAFDVLQVVLVFCALVADAAALWAIAARINEFGLSPNRVAALGINVILLTNLVWTAVLYIRFLKGTGSFASLERWQTDYLPVYAGWAAIVVIFFPPLFGFV
jgi:hypothetical protein